MDIKSLEKVLIAGGYRGWYLHGGLLDGAMTIGKTAYGWEVYYSERGEKYDLRTFTSENEACEYFLNIIVGNGSAKTEALFIG